MRRVLALALVAAIASLGMPSLSFAAGARATGTTGQVSGAVRTDAGTPIANASVRLRNTGTGQVAGTTTTAANGEYSFKNVPAGNYVIELMDSQGNAVATSMPVTMETSGTVNGVAITAPVGKAGVGAVSQPGLGHFFTSTAGILLLVGAGGGLVAGVIGATTQKSPSR
jgi:hypothetical protein